uniref:Secreted protein n=1 Tax=Acrobeloides nanus TaxID=290746 RepID=A0A914CJN5_9BILA
MPCYQVLCYQLMLSSAALKCPAIKCFAIKHCFQVLLSGASALLSNGAFKCCLQVLCYQDGTRTLVTVTGARYRAHSSRPLVMGLSLQKR